MGASRRPARDVARWTDDGELRIDHARLVEADLDWMAEVQDLTLWNVTFPEGMLSRLPNLVRLDFRGGSGADVDFIRGCASLRTLSINQVRGLVDLTAIGDARELRALALYGLPCVTGLPSLVSLASLDVVELGSMKGLVDLQGLLAAPALRELRFLRRMGVPQDQAGLIAAHPTIERFGWFGEDVPARVWQPFVEEVGKDPVDWAREAF